MVSHNETEGLGDETFDDVISQIIENQSTEDVETVSGATASSNAVIEAVDNALEEARVE